MKAVIGCDDCGKLAKDDMNENFYTDDNDYDRCEECHTKKKINEISNNIMFKEEKIGLDKASIIDMKKSLNIFKRKLISIQKQKLGERNE